MRPSIFSLPSKHLRPQSSGRSSSNRISSEARRLISQSCSRNGSIQLRLSTTSRRN
ncbi:hypothetical protein LINPERHAP2_LOCUS37081 [Linum perenne]